MANMTRREFTEEAAKLTVHHANEWNDTNEKYIYCIDYLGISAHDINADTLVNAMESRLKKILTNFGIDITE